jgi:sec-independent protein translocase protein TatA
MPSIGPMELIVVLVIALVVLGPKRLPQAGQSLGDGMRQFKSAISGDDRETKHELPYENAGVEAERPAAKPVA